MPGSCSPPTGAIRRVAPHDLAAVRVLLDGWGLTEAEDFDRVVGVIPSPHPAPR